MRLAYVGNFGTSFSTENEVAKALQALDVDVVKLQENSTETWRTLTTPSEVSGLALDLLLWTRTGWDWPRHAGWTHGEAIVMQTSALSVLREQHVPTAGFHLDRWWGLDREGQIDEEPFFDCDIVCTAEGDPRNPWREHGVNHVWMPPGVSEFECGGGRYDRRLASDLCFVGSWRPGYHVEWTHRPALVDFLDARGCRFWGGHGRSMREQRLRDLYASTKINVGDSCLAGGVTHYWSDRIPETLGRGGFLLHPYVEGIEEHYVDGEHLRLWPLGDWDELDRLLRYYLDHDDERRTIAEQGRQHVLDTATYTVRMRQLLQLLEERDLLRVSA